MSRVLTTTALMGGLLAAGCSSEGTLLQTSGGGAPLPPASAWSVAVTGCPQASQCESIRNQVSMQLVSSGLARTIATSGEDRALDIRVTNLRVVPPAARVFGGVFAGRNEVNSTVTVRSRGAVLRTFDVKSASGSNMIGGQSFEVDAYKKMASQLVDALRT